MTAIRFSTGYDAVAQRIVEGTEGIGRKQAARAEVSEIVKAYVALNGVRRFDPGTSGDYLAVKTFLAERGYTLTTHGRASLYVIKAPGQRGRPKPTNWPKVIQFVDELRQKDGLEPLKRRAA
ncbi:hypothetical protein [Shinella sp.]|jgi:hypothetical protein|uniref:hypothetical protein n=1 Tax=Shinella sp. TaxID=1870904 RepID=UPI00289791F5|nr:hypothetical protein [Shinella sp.]